MHILSLDYPMPPSDNTTCKGSDVYISCVYSDTGDVDVNWIINNTEFTPMALNESILYTNSISYNSTSDTGISTLTVFAINGTTTFQCEAAVRNGNSSSVGTVTVVGK